jgi:hypothetical protein
MTNYVNRTGEINRVSGVYHSQCHNAERTILERQAFPRCGYCNGNTSWTLIRSVKSGSKSGESRKLAANCVKKAADDADNADNADGLTTSA